MQLQLELEAGIEEAIKEIQLRSWKNKGEPLIVGLSGGSGSGKTSRVGARLKHWFGSELEILTGDDYYRGQEFIDRCLAEKGRSVSWDDPEAVDLPLLADHLQALRAGYAIRKPTYSFQTGQRTGTDLFEPKPIIVVDSIFALRPPVADQLDLKLFVEVDAATQILRRTVRDQDRTGQTPEQIVHQLLHEVLPLQQQFIATTKPLADIVLVNLYQPQESQRIALGGAQMKFVGHPGPGKLRLLNANRLVTVRQMDRYFPRTNNGDWFRIRYEGEQWVLTYKGPLQPTSQRAVLNISIDYELAEEFTRLMPTAVRHVVKDRTFYTVDRAIIALDTLDMMQTTCRPGQTEFTELRLLDKESPSQRLLEIATELGLDPADAFSTSYGEW